MTCIVGTVSTGRPRQAPSAGRQASASKLRAPGLRMQLSLRKVNMNFVSIVANVTRLYPFMSGRGTLANSAIMEKIIPHSAQEYWAPSPGGQVRVRLDDFVGRAVYFFGDLDAKITWAIKRLARPGDCVIDIGAN